MFFKKVCSIWIHKCEVFSPGKLAQIITKIIPLTDLPSVLMLFVFTDGRLTIRPKPKRWATGTYGRTAPRACSPSPRPGPWSTAPSCAGQPTAWGSRSRRASFTSLRPVIKPESKELFAPKKCVLCNNISYAARQNLCHTTKFMMSYSNIYVVIYNIYVVSPDNIYAVAQQHLWCLTKTFSMLHDIYAVAQQHLWCLTATFMLSYSNNYDVAQQHLCCHTATGVVLQKLWWLTTSNLYVVVPTKTFLVSHKNIYVWCHS